MTWNPFSDAVNYAAKAGADASDMQAKQRETGSWLVSDGYGAERAGNQTYGQTISSAGGSFLGYGYNADKDEYKQKGTNFWD